MAAWWLTCDNNVVNMQLPDGLFQRRHRCGLPLWLLLLYLLELNDVSATTRDLESQGKACEAPTSADDALSRGNCEEEKVGGSLLQVGSKMHAEPSIALPQTSNPSSVDSRQDAGLALASNSDARSNVAQSNRQAEAAEGGAHSSVAQSKRQAEAAQGRVAALLTMVESVHEQATRFPTAWLVVLAISMAACIVLCMVQLASENFHDDPFNVIEGKNGHPGTVQGSPSTAASLQPARTDRISPGPSARNLSGVGASPMYQGRSPPASQQGLPLAAAAKHLCPGLVVPHGNECILAVPVVDSASSSREVASLNVQDLDGKSVIQAEVVNTRAANSRGAVAMAQRPLVVLRAGSGPGAGQSQPLLAYCKVAHDAGSRRSVYIYDARDELFAQMMKDPSSRRYILTSGRVTLKLHFEGDLQGHSITVTQVDGGAGHRVADTTPSVMAFNPTGHYYKLRVVSNVDVGLMLCALFTIDCLEM